MSCEEANSKKQNRNASNDSISKLPLLLSQRTEKTETPTTDADGIGLGEMLFQENEKVIQIFGKELLLDYLSSVRIDPIFMYADFRFLSPHPIYTLVKKFTNMIFTSFLIQRWNVTSMKFSTVSLSYVVGVAKILKQKTNRVTKILCFIATHAGM
jgi:hypothetical protein